MSHEDPEVVTSIMKLLDEVHGSKEAPLAAISLALQLVTLLFPSQLVQSQHCAIYSSVRPLLVGATLCCCPTCDALFQCRSRRMPSSIVDLSSSFGRHLSQITILSVDPDQMNVAYTATEILRLRTRSKNWLRNRQSTVLVGVPIITG